MIVFDGKSVCEGIAHGPIVFLEDVGHSAKLGASLNARVEAQRFWAAKELAKKQLQELLDKAKKNAGSTGASIFEAYISIIDDVKFKNEIENLIISENMNAELAITTAGDHFKEMFERMEDSRMQARAQDMEDLANRLITCLDGRVIKPKVIDKPSIIVAQDLTPSDVMSLDKENVLGIVTLKGSFNSHFSILARTMGIPTIIQAKFNLAQIQNGDDSIVDAYHSRFIILPTESAIEEVEKNIKEEKESLEKLQTLKGKNTLTKSGEKIALFANASTIQEVDIALENDAEGIGLFRTEYLYLSSKHFPTEEEQYKIYREAVFKMRGKYIAFRTADIGGDKQTDYMNVGNEENPAMGQRGIRYSMTHKEIFKTQLRALYRVAAIGNVAIMYPMITSIEEMEWIENVEREVEDDLRREHIDFAKPYKGIIIETPAAAIIAEELAKKVDFFSIGTNDLSQFVFAKDRMSDNLEIPGIENESMFRFVEMIVKAAKKENIKVGVCGELSGNIEKISKLIDMKVDVLSIQPKQILVFRKIIQYI